MDYPGFALSSKGSHIKESSGGAVKAISVIRQNKKKTEETYKRTRRLGSTTNILNTIKEQNSYKVIRVDSTGL